MIRPFPQSLPLALTSLSASITPKAPAVEPSPAKKISVDSLFLDNVLENTRPKSSVQNTPISFSEPPILPTQSSPIQSHFTLTLKDNNGFLNFGPKDIKASISGQTHIDGRFILEQLAKIPDSKDVVFNPPQFDSERQQYVLSGKGINKILGVFDVGFEIRFGAQNGQLAFDVDNALKRGILYKVLAKQLDKIGLSTEKQDKKLWLKPSYTQAIDIPIKKDGSHTGRINQIHSDSQKIQFGIDDKGDLSIEFKGVEVDISSQIDPPQRDRPSRPTEDTAQIDFELSMNAQLQPSITLQAGQIQSQTQTEDLKDLIPETALLHLRNEMGTALSLNLNHIQGEAHFGAEGLDLDTRAQLEITGDEQAQVSAALSASLHKEQKTLTAQGLSIDTQSGSHLKIAAATYQSPQAGPKHVEIKQANGQVDLPGLEASIEHLDAILDLPQNEQPLKITAQGHLQGKIDKAGLKASFETRGTHQASLSPETLSIEVEQTELTGRFVQAPQTETQPEKPAKSANKARDIKIQMTQAKVTGSAQTDKLSVEAQTTVSNAQVEIQTDGNISVDLDKHHMKGSFNQKQSHLNIEAELQGHSHAELKANGAISVSHREGPFSTHLSREDKIDVSGSGQDLDLDLAGNDIQIGISKPDLTTTILAQKNRIQAQTKGEQADLHLQGQHIDIKTHNTRSELELKIGDNVLGTGSSGDVQIQIRPLEKTASTQGKQSIAIQAEDTDLQAKITNKQGNLDLDVHTVGNLQLDLAGKTVSLESNQGHSDVNMKLYGPQKTSEKKVDLSAQGGNFKLDVNGPDLSVDLKTAQFSGQITPNAKLKLDLQSQSASNLSVAVSKTQIGVSSKGALSGRFALENKVSAQFNNSSGFGLEVLQNQTGKPGSITASVGQVNLNGAVHTNGVQADLTGIGDFELNLENQGGPVAINYDGKLTASAEVKKVLAGDLSVEGPVQLNLQGKDLELDLNGQLKIDAHSPQFGVNGQLNLPRSESNLNLSITNQKLTFSLAEKGSLKLEQLQDLQLNNPQLEKVLTHLLSQSAELTYQNLNLKDQNLNLDLQTSVLETTYGLVDLKMSLEKAGSEVQIADGQMNFEPSRAFYDILQESLSKKFNITIKGTPTFENGQISVEGEIRTPLGLIQLASFEISTTVADNKLVFDIEKAQVFQVIGKNGVAQFVNKMLHKTDIDVFKKSNSSLEIELADIVKDLSLTQGINFTDLKLIDNHFEVAFYFSTQDQKITKAAKAEDIAALKQLLNSVKISDLSEESLATAFSSFAKAKDSEAAVDLLQQTSKAYLSSEGQERYQLNRALNWMAKSIPARKADLEDNIAMAFVSPYLSPTSEQQFLKGLPHDFIEQLAKNIDSSDLGTWDTHWVTHEEQRAADTLRQLKQSASSK